MHNFYQKKEFCTHTFDVLGSPRLACLIMNI